jgi:hypothetical protein
MSNQDFKIEVRGIREFQKAIKQVDAELPKKLKEGFKNIATTVADEAKTKVPRKSGKAAGSIRPRSSQKGAGIAFGGSAAPYYPWLDFGGSTGRGHQPKQSGSGAIKRPFMKEGRFIYPTIRAKNAYITDTVDEVIKDLSEEAGFETRGDNK